VLWSGFFIYVVSCDFGTLATCESPENLHTQICICSGLVGLPRTDISNAPKIFPSKKIVSSKYCKYICNMLSAVAGGFT
jgi:hypothetical protein